MSLKEKYNKDVFPALQKSLDLKNVMDVPKLEKIVLNMGIGTYVRSGNKDFSSLVEHMALIAGQKPTIRYAKKAISNFKLRAGMPVGLSVTLRGEKMYDFLEKLIDIVLPRVRDFRGVSKKSFDREGNYNFGIKEHTIFPEVPHDDVIKTHGLQITVKSTAKSEDAGRALLEGLGFPFSK
ncbi:50S ribosomal protein L5 [Candidatus Gracilibacteria bacterium]|nr:50S ribosomal protein L5 [Candidatus Gracilibacteria bacterium]